MSPRTEVHVLAENWYIPAYGPFSAEVLRPDSQSAIFFNSSSFTLYCALYLPKSVSRSVVAAVVGAGDGVGVTDGMSVGVGVAVGGTGVAVGLTVSLGCVVGAVWLCKKRVGVGEI